MRVAIIGSNGQLGSELLKGCDKLSQGCHGLLHSDVEVSDPNSVSWALDRINPDVVINTAAFHKVDLCEQDPVKTFQVNSWGALNVARWCAARDKVHAFISTDYVFSGEADRPYVETDAPGPRMVYGVSKAAAESMCLNVAPKSYVFRVSAVFGVAGASGKGGNFVDTVLRLAGDRDEVAFINDMHTSVTYAPHAAAFILDVISQQLDFGIWHAANEGGTTWHEFASTIVEKAGLSCKVNTQPMSGFPFGAPRPQNSVLSVEKGHKAGVPLPHWTDGLDSYLKEKGVV